MWIIQINVQHECKYKNAFSQRNRIWDLFSEDLLHQVILMNLYTERIKNGYQILL